MAGAQHGAIPAINGRGTARRRKRRMRLSVSDDHEGMMAQTAEHG
jgi:hypothetical protein